MSWMRLIILICALIAALYWIDQTYYFGEYTRHVSMLLHDITRSFR